VAYLIGCENVHLEYPTKKVFDSVSLAIGEGDRIGIVGGNGDGKSSLFSLLAGINSEGVAQVDRESQWPDGRPQVNRRGAGRSWQLIWEA